MINYNSENRTIFSSTAEYDLNNFFVDGTTALQEARIDTPANRIVSYELWYDDQTDIVFDPGRGRIEVISMVTTDPDRLQTSITARQNALRVAELEIRAFRTFRQTVITAPDNTIALWYSPNLPRDTDNESGDNKHGYDEGRLTIGYVRPGHNQYQCRVMECHGIPVIDDMTDKIIPMINRLLIEQEQSPLSNPDDFRGLTFYAYPGGSQHYCDFLKQYLPYKDVWQSIKHGVPSHQLHEIATAMKDSFEQAYKLWTTSSTRDQIISISQTVVNQAGQYGYEIDINQLPCAGTVSSSDPLAINLTPIGKIINPFKQITSSAPGKISYETRSTTNSSEYHFVKNCGECGTKLNKMMKKGDCCPHCGGKYQGC